MSLYPFEGTPPKTWDFSRFDPNFFQHLEKRVGDLRDRGIEADLILFDPYDKGRWGFDRMAADVDDRYVRYIVSRLAAYRNVWWSLSNEYDFNKNKTESDWDRLFQVVQAADPYGHLRSIHNGFYIYNNTKPWVTHASIQNGSAVEDNGRAELYRDVYRKPVVYDEVKYEGNIARRWGQLSGEEMVFRFWEATVAGTYVTHGETFIESRTISRGRRKAANSMARVPRGWRFWKRCLAESPAEGIDPIDKWQDSNMGGQARRVLSAVFRQADADLVAVRAVQGSHQGRHEIQGRRARHVGHDHHARRGRIRDEEEGQLPFCGREGDAPSRCRASRTWRCGFDALPIWPNLRHLLTPRQRSDPQWLQVGKHGWLEQDSCGLMDHGRHSTLTINTKGWGINLT